VVRISFSKQNLTGWGKKRYTEILSKIILRVIQFNRAVRNMGNFVNVELHIRFN
jgi:hypothetical protein